MRTAPLRAVKEHRDQYTPHVEAGDLPSDVALAFAPLHKKAFGIAVGVAGALVMFLLTAVYLLREPPRPIGIALLSQFFAGYSVSWTGAVVGTLWGFAVGFVIGWFVAFCRNLALAISIFAIRTRAQLQATRDFLDHI
jgi:hypothetical protein